MFEKLQFMRLRTAEKALGNGRLDEAYRLASAVDLKDQKRARAILASLTPLLLERAREHYRSDRFTEALMDLDRAAAGGTHKEEIQELRGYVRVVAAEQARQDASKFERIAAAEKRIERGSVAAARNMLQRAPGDDVAAQAALRRHRASGGGTAGG